MSLQAKTAAATTPIVTSVAHTARDPFKPPPTKSVPTTARASGSKQSAAVTSAAPTHDRATRHRWPKSAEIGPVTGPPTIQSRFASVVAIRTVRGQRFATGTLSNTLLDI